MTRSLRRIDWAALGASLGSTVLFTLLLLSPFLWGAHYLHWLLGLAIGLVLGLYLYLRRDRLRRARPRRRRDPVSTLRRHRPSRLRPTAP
jgi:hypothetical protein